MLTISKKCKYGLKALLTLAEFYNKGLLSTKDIASRQDIPRQYLEQIFNQLGKADVIRSVRGKQGGYELALPPEKITVAEVITLLEGGIDFIQETYDPSDVTHSLFHTAEANLLETFNISLAELLSHHEKQRQVIMYDI